MSGTLISREEQRERRKGGQAGNGRPLPASSQKDHPDYSGTSRPVPVFLLPHYGSGRFS